MTECWGSQYAKTEGYTLLAFEIDGTIALLIEHLMSTDMFSETGATVFFWAKKLHFLNARIKHCI